MTEQNEFGLGEEIPIFTEFSETDIEEIKYTLHKYEGDFTAEEIDAGMAGDPTETITFINGEVVEHIIHGSEGGNTYVSN